MSSTKNKSIRVNGTVETADVQHMLQEERLQKKRDLHVHQYNRYRTTFYGTQHEKELVKSEHRQALLQQCQENERRRREALRNKVKESQAAVAEDRHSQQTDSQLSNTKLSYLRQFRDQNKVLMERRLEESHKQRAEENQKEQKLLRHDPINWSKTLV